MPYYFICVVGDSNGRTAFWNGETGTLLMSIQVSCQFTDLNFYLRRGYFYD